MAAAAWVLWLSWAASAAAGSPPAKELTDLPPPILVHYAYAGSDTAGINEFRLRNLKFFLRHAVTISHVTTPVDRVTVSGGRPDAEALLDAFDNHRNALLPPVHVLHRKNEGYDFGAHWDPGFIGPKVEGFAFAMTGPALAHVVQNGGVFKSHATKEDAIIYGEYGLTRTILEAPQKWNVASLLLEFQNMDFRDNSTWKCNDQQFPSRENTYGPGISVSPLEVLFHKARWESEENNPTVSVSETDFNFYTGWMDEGADRDVYSATHFLFDAVKHGELDEEEQAMVRGQVRALQRLGVRIGVACTILVASLLYATAKLVMAHICESSLWNITGCVPL